MSLTFAKGPKPGTWDVLLDGAPTSIVVTFDPSEIDTALRLSRLLALGQASEKYTEHFRAYSESTGSLKAVPEADLPQPVKDNLAEMVTFVDAVKKP